MKPLFYEPKQINPRWRTEEGQDSYQITIHESSDGKLLIRPIHLRHNGRKIFRAGEEFTYPEHQLLRMYAGLNPNGAKEAVKFVNVFEESKKIGGAWDSVDGLVDAIDLALVTRDELELGREIKLMYIADWVER